MNPITSEQLSDPDWCRANVAVLYDAGWSIRKIMALTGRSYGAVRAAAIAQGATMRSKGTHTRPQSTLSPGYLADVEACARAVAAGTHPEELAHRLAGEHVPALLAELAKIRTRASRQAARLEAAEAVCALLGATATSTPLKTDREKALYELWEAWTSLHGANKTRITDDQVRELARVRDAKRATTLAEFRAAVQRGSEDRPEFAGGPW